VIIAYFVNILPNVMSPDFLISGYLMLWPSLIDGELFWTCRR